ncbi:MAG: hypothetical protein ABIC57_04095 [bacterium]
MVVDEVCLSRDIQILSEDGWNEMYRLDLECNQDLKNSALYIRDYIISVINDFYGDITGVDVYTDPEAFPLYLIDIKDRDLVLPSREKDRNIGGLLVKEQYRGATVIFYGNLWQTLTDNSQRSLIENYRRKCSTDEIIGKFNKYTFFNSTLHESLHLFHCRTLNLDFCEGGVIYYEVFLLEALSKVGNQVTRDFLQIPFWRNCHNINRDAFMETINYCGPVTEQVFWGCANDEKTCRFVQGSYMLELEKFKIKDIANENSGN